jgi:hypothetical protein
MPVSLPEWQALEPWVKCTSPTTNGSTHRTRAELERVVAAHHLDSSPRYQPRDVTADSKRETFCNYAVSDITRALGCEIPTLVMERAGRCIHLRVPQQLLWLVRDGRWHGWVECDAQAAIARAQLGYPTVALWVSGSEGHIAVVVPYRGPEPELTIAQAGARCFSYGPLAAGFGNRAPVRYFTHA